MATPTFPMIKIKLLVSLAGLNRAWGPGDIYECSAQEAARHIEAGNAIPVAEEKIERAVKPTKAVEKR